MTLDRDYLKTQEEFRLITTLFKACFEKFKNEKLEPSNKLIKKVSNWLKNQGSYLEYTENLSHKNFEEITAITAKQIVAILSNMNKGDTNGHSTS